MQPFELMDWFREVPVGKFFISLDHDEQDSEPETEISTVPEIEVSSEISEVSSEISTIPGEIVQLISESSSDVELIEIISHELLSPEQENERMREQERFGHFHRVEERHSARQARLRRISEAVANESPSDRQLRRRRFYEAIHGYVRPW